MPSLRQTASRTRAQRKRQDEEKHKELWRRNAVINFARASQPILEMLGVRGDSATARMKLARGRMNGYHGLYAARCRDLGPWDRVHAARSALRCIKEEAVAAEQDLEELEQHLNNDTQGQQLVIEPRNDFRVKSLDAVIDGMLSSGPRDRRANHSADIQALYEQKKLEKAKKEQAWLRQPTVDARGSSGGPEPRPIK